VPDISNISAAGKAAIGEAAIANGAASVAQLQALMVAIAATGVGETTLSALNGDLAHQAGTLGVVSGDPVPSNDGYYTKLGASGSGSWSPLGVPLTVNWQQLALALIRREIDLASPTPRQLFDYTEGQNNTALDQVGGGGYGAENYYLSGFIPLTGGNTYVANITGPLGVYDYNEAFLGVEEITSGTPFTPTANVAFGRIQIYPMSVAGQISFVKGTILPSSYEGFGFPTPAQVNLTALTQARNAVNAALPANRNLFDQTQILANSAISSVNGAIYTATNYFVTPVIGVEPGGNFVSTQGSNSGVFYDINGEFLSGIGASATPPTANILPNTAYAVPAGAYSMQFQLEPLSLASELTIVNGSTPPAGYLPFGGGGAAYPSAGIRIGFFGNSQTNNGLFQPEVLAVTGGSQSFNSGHPGYDFGGLEPLVSGLTLAGTDVVVVTEGANEWGGAARPLGAITDAVGASTTFGQIKAIIEGLYALKDSILIVFTGNTYRAPTNISSVVYTADTTANGQGVTGLQIDQAIEACCQLYGCGFVPLRQASGINAKTETGNIVGSPINTWTAEGLHWSAGAPRVGRQIGAVINEIC
jgi:hypothetical protein